MQILQQICSIRHHFLQYSNEGSKKLTQTLDEEGKSFLGGPRTFVHKLEFLEPKLEDSIPIYRVFDQQGKIIDSSQDPNVSSANLNLIL